MYDKRVKVNTKNKIKIEKFNQNYVSNIAFVKEILEKRKYIPGKYNIFIIKEPKVRLIMSQNIIDKLVNHLVSEYFLVRVFDKSLIDLNVATRINKGTHYGIKKLVTFLRKNINKDLYILKFDISKYFFNLDHSIIKNIIRKKIKDKDALGILDNIIDSTDQYYVNKKIEELKKREIKKILNSNMKDKDKLVNDIKNLPNCKKGVSLPIGNMSSQAFAILYLNELDHYIKRILKPLFYERYMDDGILIAEDKEFLVYCLNEITRIVNKYKLELNSKTKIYKLDNGFKFLGFKYVKKNKKLIIKVKNQTKKKFKRKLKKLYKLYSNNKISYKEVLQVKASYLGHLNYGDTKNLINSTLKKYEKDKYYDYGKEVKVLKNGEIVIM